MRLATSPRAERLWERLPSAYSAAELALIALIAIQTARLFWALVTPLGPVGEWRAPSTLVAAPATARLGDFDPFFRLAGAGGPMAVTGLNLRLYGVREDRATGRGSAIIGLPDGTQNSYAVGEEIMPGVSLAAVGFDNVTISRGGVMEQIFLDQSLPAPAVGAAVSPSTPQVVMPQPGAPAAPPIVTVPTPSPGVPANLTTARGGDPAPRPRN